MSRFDEPGHVYTSSPLDKVREFHVASGTVDQHLTNEVIALRRKLIHEEWRELTDELNYAVYCNHPGMKTNRKELAKELADLLYVVYGTAVAFGIDLDRVFDEVHKSNMSKFSGECVVREDGKILKGEHYRPPNLDFVEES